MVKDIAPENLIFLDEMGVLLGLTRTQARSLQGTRVYHLKPFYRGAKVTVIGAIQSDACDCRDDPKRFHGW